jgi:peptidoglycan hydrolase CwlO-like protein
MPDNIAKKKQTLFSQREAEEVKVFALTTQLEQKTKLLREAVSDIAKLETEIERMRNERTDLIRKFHAVTQILLGGFDA